MRPTRPLPPTCTHRPPLEGGVACKRWVVRKWLGGTPLTMAVGANWRIRHTKWATQIRPLTGQEGDLAVFTDPSNHLVHLPRVC